MSPPPTLRFGVWGLGFRVWGLELGIWGLGFGVCYLGFGVCDVGFEVSGLGLRVSESSGRSSIPSSSKSTSVGSFESQFNGSKHRLHDAYHVRCRVPVYNEPCSERVRLCQLKKCQHLNWRTVLFMSAAERGGNNLKSLNDIAGKRAQIKAQLLL